MRTYMNDDVPSVTRILQSKTTLYVLNVALRLTLLKIKECQLFQLQTDFHVFDNKGDHKEIIRLTA